MEWPTTQTIIVAGSSRAQDGFVFILQEEQILDYSESLYRDLLVTATNPACVDKVFEELKVLKIKGLGVVRKVLGVSVSYEDWNGYNLDQEAMI